MAILNIQKCKLTEVTEQFWVPQLGKNVTNWKARL